jgi:hypothetical protein
MVQDIRIVRHVLWETPLGVFPTRSDVRILNTLSIPQPS